MAGSLGEGQQTDTERQRSADELPAAAGALQVQSPEAGKRQDGSFRTYSPQRERDPGTPPFQASDFQNCASKKKKSLQFAATHNSSRMLAGCCSAPCSSHSRCLKNCDAASFAPSCYRSRCTREICHLY